MIISNLNGNDFKVLCYLIARSKDGKCFPSVGTISKEINISKSTVLRSLDNLIKESYITREQRTIGTGKKTSNIYTINKDYLAIKQVQEEPDKSEEVELYDYNWLEED